MMQTKRGGKSAPDQGAADLTTHGYHTFVAATFDLRERCVAIPAGENGGAGYCYSCVKISRFVHLPGAAGPILIEKRKNKALY